jgi:DNA-binding transcriptional ArsR family regulator
VKLSHADILVALADPTRSQIVDLLLAGELSVGEISNHLPVSRPAVSKHLKLMEEAGLVSYSSQGTRNLYRIRPEALSALRDQLEKMWVKASQQFVARARAKADSRGGKDE